MEGVVGERPRESQMGEKGSSGVGKELPFGNRIFSIIRCSQEGRWESRVSFPVGRNPAAAEKAGFGMVGCYLDSDVKCEGKYPDPFEL